MKNNLKIEFNPVTSAYTVAHKGFQWVSDGRKPYVIIRKRVGKKFLSTYRPLASALKKDTQYTENEIICRYSGYVAFGKKLPFTLICTAKITGSDTVEFSLKAENENDFDIQAVYFPAPFNAKKKSKESYHIDAMRQGFLMPDGYKKNFLSTFGFANYLRKINTGDCYMPLWGRVSGKYGFSAIVETPFDACMFSSFGRHGAFVNSVHWRSSLGKLGYERKIRFTFHDNCDYNTIAKDYRSYLKEKGQFVSIDEKISKNSNIKNLIGCPVLHHRVYTKIQPESKFYDKNGTNDFLCATFEERAEQLKTIKKMGLEKLYIHTDGWGVDGYDNKHPYILPPCEKAGGWEGLKSLSEVCRSLNYIFALHDQYRDFYYSSKAFDMDKSILNIDGSHPFCSIWDGGKHSFLCAAQALPFVKQTYSELEEHGVDVQGAYLDVFAVVPGDECFNKDHMQTREQSIKSRAECLDYLNDRGLIMSSEEPAMQLLNSIALVHHGPHTLRPQESGEAVGIPVPLGSLVFHDCLMIPWDWWNNWGIPKGESGEAYCALHAGMPYFHPFGMRSIKLGTGNLSADSELASENELKKEIERVKSLSELQERLYNKEMVSHKFLDDSYKIQQTIYSDGTVITADVENSTYNIKYGEEDADI